MQTNWQADASNQALQTKVVVMNKVESLRDLRDKRGMTLRELADKLPISHSQTHRNEQKGYVKPEHRDAYAKALDVGRGFIDGLCEDGDQPTRRVTSDAELLAWTRAASTSGASPYARMLLLVLPVFLNDKSWVVSVSQQRLSEEAHIPLDSIAEHWDELLASPLLERIGPGEWTFHLLLPQS